MLKRLSRFFGSDAIAKALAGKNPWASLTTVGNSKPRPFKWVTSEELQIHIQERLVRNLE